MNRLLTLFGLASLSIMIDNPKHQAVESFSKKIVVDTLPDICVVLPAAEIAALSPFTVTLSNSYPEDPIEGYRGCLYEFFKSPDFGTIKISVLKLKSKADALADYKMQIEDHIRILERRPESITGLADSAFFTYDAFDDSKCDNCGLSLLLGVYNVNVILKGQYDDVLREKKKNAAISIVKLLFNRMPELLKQK
jgi:hypothetical protein